MIQELKNKKKPDKKSIAWLIDPDKSNPNRLDQGLDLAEKIGIDLFLIGGSLVFSSGKELVTKIKDRSDIPLLLFPGSLLQLYPGLDGILLLSLISGRNPEYLIGHHVIAAPKLNQLNAAKIATGYMLIDGGVTTSVHYMSNTQPIPADKPDIALATALAGEMLGHETLYLDAGSGAKNPVPNEMIELLSSHIDLPMFIGGGIRSKDQAADVFRAGADIVVVGTAAEESPEILEELVSVRDDINNSP